MEDANHKLLLQLLESHYATQYLTVVSATILIWDILVTFNVEVQRVWRARKTLGTTLFFVNRYIPLCIVFYDLYYVFAPTPSINFCHTYEITFGALGIVTIATVESVLILRTNALFRNNLLSIFLIVLGVVSLVTMSVLFFMVVQNTDFLPHKPPGYSFCYAKCKNSKCLRAFNLLWIPLWLFETLIVVIIFRKYFAEYRSLTSAARSTVLSVIMRDGLLYYLVVIGSTTCAVILWGAAPIGNFYAMTLGRSLQAMVCSRMLLNLRGLLETTTRTAQFGSTTPGTILHLHATETVDGYWETEEDEEVLERNDQRSSESFGIGFARVS